MELGLTLLALATPTLSWSYVEGAGGPENLHHYLLKVPAALDRWLVVGLTSLVETQGSNRRCCSSLPASRTR